MTNTKALLLLNEVEELITNSKKQVLTVVDKDDTTKIVDIKEIEPLLDIPSKIAYALLKNRNSLVKVAKEQEDLVKEIKDTYTKEVQLDESKYSSDKEYAKEIDKGLSKVFKDNELLKEFAEAESDYTPYTVKVSIDTSVDKDTVDLTKIDPQGKFKLSYVTNSIFENIILIE